MELFNKINLDTPSNDDELIKKYDYIKFLKNEKAFEKSGKLNLFYEESKSIGLMDFYKEHRNSLKIKKYIKKLKNKIDKFFFPSKFYLNKLEKVNENIEDLKEFEKITFNIDTVSSIESYDSNSESKLKKEKGEKIKINKKEFSIKTKTNNKKNISDSKKVIEFMKENSELVTKFVNFSNEIENENHKKNIIVRSIFFNL